MEETPKTGPSIYANVVLRVDYDLDTDNECVRIVAYDQGTKWVARPVEWFVPEEGERYPFILSVPDCGTFTFKGGDSEEVKKSLSTLKERVAALESERDRLLTIVERLVKVK